MFYSKLTERIPPPKPMEGDWIPFKSFVALVVIDEGP